jgi:ankyrin repeat protein
MAARKGRLDIVCCLAKELGADVNKASANDMTPLYIAAQEGQLDIVCCLVNEFSVDVHQARQNGSSPLFIAAYLGYLDIVHWLLVEGGASVDDIHGSQGYSLWHSLELEDVDDAELTSLLQTMVLLADAPLSFIAKLSQQQAELWERGRLLRTWLQAYRDLQRAYIATACPLPGVLQPLVAEYAAPTSEDMWTYGLRL